MTSAGYVPGRGFEIGPGTDLEGLRCTVMGLGRFSGGVETVRFLAGRGARVLVTDRKAADAFPESVEAVSMPGVELKLGGHDLEDFRRADLVVVSPAVPPESPYVSAAAKMGIPVVTELSLTMQLLPCPSAFVTGTCGKSTTTALLGGMLEEGGIDAHVGGNIGRALIGEVGTYAPEDVAVLEVSSFQLEWLARDGIRPDLAIVTQVTPNHLDRHKTFDRYVEAKTAALAARGPVILNADDPVSRERLVPAATGPVYSTSLRSEPPRGAFLSGNEGVYRGAPSDPVQPLFHVDDLRIPGTFNRMNALQAALAARLMGAPPGAIAPSLRSFRGLPHRLEDLGWARGVRGVNDSKATTPAAAERALSALASPLVVVAGGYERGADLESFARALRERARAVVLLGESAPRLAEAVGSSGPSVALATSIEQAVERGMELAEPGDTLLLSPGHASWDMFENYEERGDRFRRRFLAMAEEGDANERGG